MTDEGMTTERTSTPISEPHDDMPVRSLTSLGISEQLVRHTAKTIAQMETLAFGTLRIPGDVSIGALASRISKYAELIDADSAVSKLTRSAIGTLSVADKVYDALEELRSNTHVGVVGSTFYKTHILPVTESHQKLIKALSGNVDMAASIAASNEMTGLKFSSSFAASIGAVEKMFLADNLLSAVRSNASTIQSGIPSAIEALTFSHTNFMNAAEQMFKNISPIDPDVETFTRLSSTEYFNESLAYHEYFRPTTKANTHSTATSTIQKEKTTLIKEINVEIEEVLLKELPMIDADLVKLWEGAKRSLQSNNPDKIRHTSISLREMLTTVLHKKAPNEDVKKWSTDPSHYHNNKPTRKARLEYMTKHKKNSKERDFVKADIEATLKLIDLFHDHTHSIRSTEDDANSLQVLLQRAGGTIVYLLQI